MRNFLRKLALPCEKAAIEPHEDRRQLCDQVRIASNAPEAEKTAWIEEGE
jgi:hypothetical protein